MQVENARQAQVWRFLQNVAFCKTSQVLSKTLKKVDNGARPKTAWLVEMQLRRYRKRKSPLLRRERQNISDRSLEVVFHQESLPSMQQNSARFTNLKGTTFRHATLCSTKQGKCELQSKSNKQLQTNKSQWPAHQQSQIGLLLPSRSCTSSFDACVWFMLN